MVVGVNFDVVEVVVVVILRSEVVVERVNIVAEKVVKFVGDVENVVVVNAVVGLNELVDVVVGEVVSVFFVAQLVVTDSNFQGYL